MTLSLVTAPTVEPLTLAEAKSHLRVDISDDDTLIKSKLKGVRQDLEEKYGVAFISQTWDLYMDSFPGDKLEIAKWPLQSVTHIKYTDEDGDESTFSSDDYLVDIISKPGKVVLKRTASWPSDTLQEVNGVVVRFVAGYGNAGSDVPWPIKQALLLLLGDAYENREDTIIAQGVTIQKQKEAAKVIMMNYRSFG